MNSAPNNASTSGNPKNEVLPKGIRTSKAAVASRDSAIHRASGRTAATVNSNSIQGITIKGNRDQDGSSVGTWITIKAGKHKVMTTRLSTSGVASGSTRARAKIQPRAI